MKKIQIFIFLVIILSAVFQLQTERGMESFVGIPEDGAVSAEWLPGKGLHRATYGRCYALNARLHARRHAEAAAQRTLGHKDGSTESGTYGMLQDQPLAEALPNGISDTANALDADLQGQLLADAAVEAQDSAAEVAENDADATMINTEFVEVSGPDCPKAAFHGETDDLMVFVSVKEDVFPDGTEMRVEPVETDYAVAAANGSGMEATDALAADITFWHDGEEVQPQGNVFVQLTAKRDIAGERHHSMTIDNDGNATLIAGAASTASIFNTDHFTVYGIIGGNYTDDDVEEHVRHTYIFYVDNVKVDKIIVHNGDAFTPPADPAGDAKHTFDGWYEIETDENGAPAKDGDAWKLTEKAVTSAASYDKVADDETEDRIIHVAAKFNEQYTVTIYTNEDKKVVFHTYTDRNEETVSLISPADAMTAGFLVSAGEKLTGWKNIDPDGPQVTSGNTITIDGADIELVPVFASSHNVKFELFKESFEPIPDQNVLDGDKVVKTRYVEGETYKGYRLGGWYTDYDPEEEDPEMAFDEEDRFNLEDVLTKDDGDITLYAQWIPAEVKYTIEVRLENANDDGYSVISKEEIQGETDSEINVESILGTYHKDKYKNYIFNGDSNGPGYFHWAGTGEIDGNEEPPLIQVLNGNGDIVAEYNGTVWSNGKSGKIGYDGNTVVRVNYCRDTYKLQFLFINSMGGNITDPLPFGEFEGNTVLNANGKQHAPAGYENATLPEIYVKYGQSLYEATHSDSSMGNMFDAFLGNIEWHFENHNFGGGGKTVFNGANRTFPVRPDSPVDDGERLYCTVYLKGGQRMYPFITLYYSSLEAYQNGADPVRGDSVEAAYDNGHKHIFAFGGVSDGYRLVNITNYDKVFVNNNNNEEFTGERQENVTYKYSAKVIDGIIKPLYLHMVPVAHSIIFKQTKNDGYVNNGEKVSEESAKQDVVVPNVLFNSVVTSVINDNAPHWPSLTDDRGVLYTCGPWTCELTDDYEAPEIMPDHDLVFYLNWYPEMYTVIYDFNYDADGDEMNERGRKDLFWGARVPDPATVSENTAGYLNREGWVLLGWKAYEYEADYKRGDNPVSEGYFNFNTTVKGNLFLVAEWAKPDDGYQVVYLKGAHGTVNGEDSVNDPKNYAMAANAPVKYIATPEEGWVFTGWAIGGIVDENTKLYGSGDVFGYSEAADHADGEEDSVLTLVAQYEKIERKTDVTYHTNFPDGTGQTERDNKLERFAVWNDQFIVAAPDTDLGFPRRVTAGDITYEFVAWTNTEGEKIFTDDSSREYFYPGEAAAAGIEDNHLYATWRVIRLMTLTVNKIWSDADNAYGSRPASVTIRVLAGGVEEARVTFGAENSWTHTFTGLDASKTYTVEEVNVPEGYTVSYSGNAEDGFTVTNAHTPVTPADPDPDPDPDPWEPELPETVEFSCSTSDESIIKGRHTAETCTPLTVGETEYAVVLVNGHCWMRENLRTATPHSMVYSTGLNPGDETIYGRLYPEKDAARACPDGWHLPELVEVAALTSYEADDLRSTEGWLTPGTNASGFNARPAGYYNSDIGRFEGMRSEAVFYTHMRHDMFTINYHCCAIIVDRHNPNSAYSIRCVKDAPEP